MTTGPDPGGTPPGTQVQVHGGQGIQVGDHNRQVNQFILPAPVPVALA